MTSPADPLQRPPVESGRGIDALWASLDVAELLGLTAHQLNNPLMTLALRIRQARAERPDDAELGLCLDAMDWQVDHLQRLLDDLMAWARPAGRVRPAVFQPTDMSAVVRGAVEAMTPLACSQQVSFSLAMQSRQNAVNGEADRLLQMCINLISHALKIVDSGGTVAIELRRDGGGQTLRIHDPRCGAHLDEIIRPGDSNAAALDALDPGPGWAMARQVAQEHGGWLRVQSTAAQRPADFVIWLPAADGSRVSPHPPGGGSRSRSR